METGLVLGQAKFGGSELRLGGVRVAKPEPKAGEVRVRVEAVSINPKDVSVVQNEDGIGGLLSFMVGSPFYPGSDLAGVVEAVGPDVDDLAVGDRVATYRFFFCGGTPGYGAFGTFAIVPAASAARIPEAMESRIAAALPCAFLTALQVLRDRVRLHRHPARRPVVVVYGASGGVGSPCVQMAHLLRGRAGDDDRGAFVIAVASERNRKRCLEDLGANAFVPYDGETDAFEGVARAVRSEGLAGVHAWVECHIPAEGPQIARVRPLLVPATRDASWSGPPMEPWMPGKFVSLRPSIPVALITEAQRRTGEAVASCLSCGASPEGEAGDGAVGAFGDASPPVTWAEPTNDFIAVRAERLGLEVVMRWVVDGKVRVDIAKQFKGLVPGVQEAVEEVATKHTQGKVVVLIE